MICYVPLCFHCGFGSFILIPLLIHNSVNFVIGISSMRLNEGCVEMVFGLIIIEITRGPSLHEHW